MAVTVPAAGDGGEEHMVPASGSVRTGPQACLASCRPVQGCPRVPVHHLV